MFLKPRDITGQGSLMGGKMRRIQSNSDIYFDGTDQRDNTVDAVIKQEAFKMNTLHVFFNDHFI